MKERSTELERGAKERIAHKPFQGYIKYVAASIKTTNCMLTRMAQ